MRWGVVNSFTDLIDNGLVDPDDVYVLLGVERQEPQP